MNCDRITQTNIFNSIAMPTRCFIQCVFFCHCIALSHFCRQGFPCQEALWVTELGGSLLFQRRRIYMSTNTQFVECASRRAAADLETFPLRHPAGNRHVPRHHRSCSAHGLSRFRHHFCQWSGHTMLYPHHREKLPLYYGSSFSYLPAIAGLMASDALSRMP